MKVCAKEVYDRKNIGGIRREGCEWWNENIERNANKKIELFENCLLVISFPKQAQNITGEYIESFKSKLQKLD